MSNRRLDENNRKKNEAHMKQQRYQKLINYRKNDSYGFWMSGSAKGTGAAVSIGLGTGTTIDSAEDCATFGTSVSWSELGALQVSTGIALAATAVAGVATNLPCSRRTNSTSSPAAGGCRGSVEFGGLVSACSNFSNGSSTKTDVAGAVFQRARFTDSHLSAEMSSGNLITASETKQTRPLHTACTKTRKGPL